MNKYSFCQWESYNLVEKEDIYAANVKKICSIEDVSYVS
jgi:hypothetical protein